VTDPVGGHDRAPGEAVVAAVLEASPHSMVVVDGRGTVTHANRRALAQLGYRADELVGSPVELVLPDPGGEGGARHGRRRDGSTFPAELSRSTLVVGDEQRVVTGIVDVGPARADAERLLTLNRAFLTLARLNQATVRARNAAELYAETCRLAVEEGGYLGAWVLRRGPGSRVQTLATAGTLDDYIARLDISLDPASPRGRGPTARTLRDGHATFSEDFAADPTTAPWRELAASYGIGAAASLPVRSGGRLVAAFTLWSARSFVFDERMRTLLVSLGENLSFALDGFEAARRLERSVTQRGELLNRLVVAQEEERTRIASTVHDDSVQALAAVDLRLGLLARRVAGVAPELSATVAQLQGTVEAVSGGLRRMLFELEPAGSDVPLVDLLREAAGHVFEGRDLHWSVLAPESATPVGADLSPLARGQALRIVRAALVEVRDRAGVTQVAVRARDLDGGIDVTVTDDGNDDGRHPHDDPLGRLRDRAETAGGWCRAVHLDPGCELRFWLPREVPGAVPG
jgi:signal transduction histidine kinase